LDYNAEIQKLTNEIEELDSKATHKAIVESNITRSNSIFRDILEKKHDLEWLTWWYGNTTCS